VGGADRDPAALRDRARLPPGQGPAPALLHRRCDWYVAEIDDDEWLAFGYADLKDSQNAEWETFSLTELEGVVIEPGFVVERDLAWDPKAL
jgi:hypothetical protein